MKKTTLLFIFLFLIISNAWAQNSIFGKVVNQEGEELIGVNISVKTISGLGSVSDFEGNYQLSLPDGCNEILFQYIGFEDYQEEVCLKKNEAKELNITLKESSEILGTVVVSAGKFEQRIEEVTVSMDVIKPELIENKSATSIDRTINQAPSVHIVDGQANIRSGSGWSYGAGSRVMVMVDGMPLMSGDQGAAEWQLVPMENISQIEVIKGASSVLFGSSALNGTINIRTAYPTSEPVNKLSVIHTAYGKPNRKSLHWYKGGYTSASNISYLHSHKKDNKDFVLGANLFYDGGFQYKVISKRARINFNHTTYSKQVEGLSYGVKTNFMRSKIGDAIMWNHDTLAYNPLDNDPGFRNNAYFSVDPFITYSNPDKGTKHTINSRYFRINILPGYLDSLKIETVEATGQQEAYVDTSSYSANEAQRFSTVYFTDYQFQKQVKDFITLTSGYTYKYCEGQDAQVYGKSKNINHSLYTQVDFKREKLNISFGGRFEHFNDGDNIINKPIFRSGINYQLAEATFLRGSYGEGIRFPTMLERFVTYNTGAVYIYPNPNLQPESGWNAELGIKQAMQIREWRGFVDIAAFVMEYNDMMEFSFGRWGDLTHGLGGLGFKSINIGDSRIKGLEFSIAGEGKIGDYEINLLGSYTYTSPYIDDIYNVYNEYTTILGGDTITDPISYYTTSIDTSGVLKYRYEHLGKFDLMVQKNRINFGLSLRYNSAMRNIDLIFNEPLFELTLGTKTAWNNLNVDNTLLDFRVGYDLTDDSRISFNIDNLFNREYLHRPASLGAPRMYSLLYNIKF